MSEKKQIRIILYGFSMVFIFVLAFYNWPALNKYISNVYADISEIVSIPQSQIQLIEKPVFKENEQSTVAVHPRFNDESTNIAFYINCVNHSACFDNISTDTSVDTGTTTPKLSQMVFAAENLGHGYLPFSEYWAPDPAIGKYTAIEYYNDNQQFSCSDLSVEDCVNDSHFISRLDFEITSNNPDIVLATTTENITTLSSIDGVATSSISDTVASTSVENTIVIPQIDGVASSSISDSIPEVTLPVVSGEVTLVFPDSIGTMPPPTTLDTNPIPPVVIEPTVPVVEVPAIETPAPPEIVQDASLNTTVTY